MTVSQLEQQRNAATGHIALVSITAALAHSMAELRSGFKLDPRRSFFASYMLFVCRRLNDMPDIFPGRRPLIKRYSAGASQFFKPCVGNLCDFSSRLHINLIKVFG